MGPRTNADKIKIKNESATNEHGPTRTRSAAGRSQSPVFPAERISCRYCAGTPQTEFSCRRVARGEFRLFLICRVDPRRRGNFAGLQPSRGGTDHAQRGGVLRRSYCRLGARAPFRRLPPWPARHHVAAFAAVAMLPALRPLRVSRAWTPVTVAVGCHATSGRSSTSASGPCSVFALSRDRAAATEKCRRADDRIPEAPRSSGAGAAIAFRLCLSRVAVNDAFDAAQIVRSRDGEGFAIPLTCATSFWVPIAPPMVHRRRRAAKSRRNGPDASCAAGSSPGPETVSRTFDDAEHIGEASHRNSSWPGRCEERHLRRGGARSL